MKNRVQLLAIALATFNAFAKENNIAAPNGFDPQDTTMYVTANLRNKGGAIQLVDANTKKIEGITNFDGSKLSKGRYLILDGVRVLVDNAAVSLDVATFKSDALPQVLASHLVITQGTKRFEIPVSDAFNGNSATSNGDDYREIGHLPIIEAEKEFKIEWVFPATGGPGDVICFARVEFRTTEVFIN